LGVIEWLESDTELTYCLHAHTSEHMTGVTMIRAERRASASNKLSADQTDDIMDCLKEEDANQEELPDGVAKMVANSFC
jgi:hypothetical protein